MSKYFFDLAGDIPARDVVGRDYADDEEARSHGSFIARRIGAERPEMVRDGNFISVRDEQDNELFQIPLASTTV